MLLSLNGIGQSNQQFQFSIDSLTIEEALSEISQQTDIPIIFSSNLLPTDEIVYINEKITIEEALLVCLAQTELSFILRGEKYIISAQSHTTRINGFVVDAENGERLIGAHIVDIDGQISVTNEYGFFSLEVESNQKKVQFSYIGYKSKLIPIASINAGEVINLDRDNELATIIVDGSTRNENETKSIINSADGINLDNISDEQVGSIGGEADIVQKLQTLTGVQAFPDALGGWHIRGGGTEQNQILVDGAQIYNPSHALGVLSIFNSDAVRYQRLYKGNMPAEYGGFSSSALELYTKEGNANHFEGKVSIGLVSAKVQFEGPIVKNRASFFISARKSIIDPLVGPISSRIKEKNASEGVSSYSMYDVNTKLNFVLNKNHRLYLSFYKGGDKMADSTLIQYRDALSTYTDIDDGEYKWGNTVASFRWNHILSKKSFGNLIATYSEFKYSNEVYNLDKAILFKDTSEVAYFTLLNSDIKDISVRWDVDILQSKKHRIEAGSQFTYRHFVPGIFSQEFDFEDFSEVVENDSFFIANNDFTSRKELNSIEVAAYFKDNIKIGELTELDLGLRFNVLTTSGKLYINPEPRIQLRMHSKNANWHWNTSFTKTTQFSHLLSPSEGGLPSDLWVPVTENIKPQHAWLAATGFKYLNHKVVNIQFDTYYKRLYNQLLYDPNSFINVNREAASNSEIQWESDVLVGKGWSAGTEVSVERVTKQYRIFAGYTLSWAKRQYNELNNGAYFPYRFDRRHDLSLSFSYKLNDKVSIYTNWFFGSGYPITLSRNRFSFLSPGINVIDDYSNDKPINNYRLKPYHRMDIGMNVKWEKPKVKHALQLGVYNLYNRRNALSAYLQVDPIKPWQTNTKEISLLAILPSISYSLSFGNKNKEK